MINNKIVNKNKINMTKINMIKINKINMIKIINHLNKKCKIKICFQKIVN